MHNGLPTPQLQAPSNSINKSGFVVLFGFFFLRHFSKWDKFVNPKPRPQIKMKSFYVI